MVTGVSYLELHLPHCNSLKEKRRILKSILERIRDKYNVSVAEVDHHDLWRRASVGIAYVTSTDYQAKKTLKNIERSIEDLNKAHILSSHIILYKED